MGSVMNRATKTVSSLIFLGTLTLGFGAAANPVPLEVAPGTARCIAGDAACPIRIRFARGAVSARVSAFMRGGRDVKWFVFDARVGQRLSATVGDIAVPEARVAVFLYAPGGALVDGGPGGVGSDGLPVTGTYRIKVRESLARGPAFRAAFRLTLTIR